MRQPWPGGYIHRQKNGAKLFIIERKIRGQRFHVSTRAHDWDAAMKQLAKFEADPGSYNPAVSYYEGAPVFLTTELVVEYVQHCILAKEKGGRGNTRHHAREKGNRLVDWQEDLAGRDLRSLDLIRDLKAALERRTTCRPHRIIALKAFFAWLRTEKGLLKHAEDRTLDLKVPQAIPERHRRRKVVAFEHVELVFAQLDQRARDVLVLKVATGMHMTELQRFVRDEGSELVAAQEGADHLAVMRFLHKSRDWNLVPLLHPEQVAAARRLKDSGTFPSRVEDELKAACEKAGVPVFGFGQIRHCVATWAVQAKADPAAVSRFIGHKDPRTVKKFYLDLGVPVPAIPTRRLKLVGA